MSVGQICIRKIGIDRDDPTTIFGFCQLLRSEAALSDACILKIGALELDVGQSGLCEVSPVKGCPAEVRVRQMRLPQAGTTEACITQVCAVQSRSTQVAVTQVGLCA